VNKGELIKQVASEIGTTEKNVSVTLNTILKAITNAVTDGGEKVTLVGFATFEPRERQERKGRNPQTGKSLTISATTYPAFSAGKHFKDAVADGGD